ncbi:MAG: hypothetical protein FWF79_10360 [Defluviitaleaceae bacterium]|nr:hypothetical protein [Defluviitaleaceae bacterium]
MEDLRKVRCPECKEFYTFPEGLPPEFCPACTEKNEEQANILRELIRCNKGINAMELQKMTGIHINFITKMMDDGEIAPITETPPPLKAKRWT